MANPRWITDGWDLHLVAPAAPGQTVFSLAPFFLPDGIHPWTPANTDWPDPFSPVFPFDLNTHGVEVRNDGILTFGPNATVRNFIVNAVGTSTVAIRIHRHDRLDSVELTPSRLTLRQSEGNQLRFSVLAVFKDHVSGTDIPCVADISQHPGLRWSITPGTGAALTPDQSGFVVPLGQNATGSETVGLTLPADLLIGAPSLPPLTATIQLAPAWDTPLQDALRPIAGPGFGKINDIPNFVILPDGFANRTEFSDAALGLIDKVRELGTLAPWNMFLAKKSDAMNFWLAWVPSPDEGGNEIGELYRAGDAAPPVPAPAELATGTSIVNLPNLIYRVGLPTLADGAAPNFQFQMAIWQGLYSAAYLAGVTEDLWRQWKNLATRFLAREVDTTFGISIGHRPQLPPQSTLNIGLHPFRAARRNIDLLLSQLFIKPAGQGNITVGSRWVSGADRKNVIILSKGPRERGTDNGTRGLVVLTLTDRGYSRPEIAPSVPAIVTLRVPPAPTDVSSTASTFTHELSHVYRAGDEYVKLGLNLPADSVNGVQTSYWNLLVDREPRDQAGKLSIAGMRWSQWPRVAAANFVKDKPTVTESVPFDRIRVQFQPGGTQPFQDALDNDTIDKDSDIFRLRQGTLVEFTSVSGQPEPRPISELMSPPMKLVTIDAVNNLIDLDEVTNGDLSDWMNGLDPDDTEPLRLLAIQLDATAGEQPVMHPAIASHIVNHGTNGRPLNRKPNSGDQCVFDNRAVQPSDGLRDLPASIKLPIVPSRVIGLYDGGATFSCGVFHAAGGCLMRSDVSVLEGDPRSPDPPKKLRKTRAATYCHVCRYLLVEQLSPKLHAEIDLLYKVNYPR